MCNYTTTCRQFALCVAMIMAAAAAATTEADEAKTKGNQMSYHEATELLSKHTGVVELTDGDARVAVCPEYQGRVMTSTCGGPDGPSFGFVNRRFIEAGKCDPRFNNYGGEDRLWLSPEGGQFSLWFKPGAEQNLDNWYTPPALNEGAWKVVSGSDGKSCRMTTTMKFQNASAADFKLDVAREVRLLGTDDLKNLFGTSVADTLGLDSVKMVGYLHFLKKQR